MPNQGANTPFLRADGTVCEKPGYDAQSHLLFKPDGETYPPIPQQPSKDDALAALAKLGKLIETFPFVAPADRSVTLSAILTALDRPAMLTAPLHAFTAPAAGTGKSLLVDVAAMLATGRRMPVIAPGQSEEELEKRLGAALLAGDVAISLDNCTHQLESTFLCQVLTQEKLNIRMLGHSRNVETPVNATIFATGNNLTIVGDLTRRTLMCQLDARCEYPERRRFNVDAVELARIERAELVSAALTILRAWHVAGETVERSPFGGFEDWSRRIRAPLLWLGQADPCDTTCKVQTDDPKLLDLKTVMAQWRQNIGMRVERTAQQAINVAISVNDFHVALLNVAQAGGNMVSNKRLGRWLKQNEGRIVDGLTFRSRHADNSSIWSLVPVSV
jgi:putative DNA primase/helicase